MTTATLASAEQLVAEVERLRARVAELESTAVRRLIAWQRARTRARATAGAADRSAGRAAELHTALQDTVASLLAGQIERDGLHARVAAARDLHPKHPDSEHCQYDGEPWPCPTLRATAGDGTPKSPWQRAVDGLNTLVDAGIPVHVEPDGHISNPCGTEHIEWDRAAERWKLLHDEDDADAEPHPEPCPWPASPDCTCAGPVPYALTQQATRALARPSVDKLRGILAPSREAGA